MRVPTAGLEKSNGKVVAVLSNVAHFTKFGQVLYAERDPHQSRSHFTRVSFTASGRSYHQDVSFWSPRVSQCDANIFSVFSYRLLQRVAQPPVVKSYCCGDNLFPFYLSNHKPVDIRLDINRCLVKFYDLLHRLGYLVPPQFSEFFSDVLPAWFRYPVRHFSTTMIQAWCFQLSWILLGQFIKQEGFEMVACELIRPKEGVTTEKRSAHKYLVR